jgi:protein-S-isoprenylcysteine O-methyltransferase Ste14
MLIMSEKTNFILRFILFAVAHSLFATASVKKIFHGTDRQGYRLCYNAVSLAMFGWVMSAYRHSKVLYFVPGIWGLIMYLLQLVVIAILVICLKQTGAGEFFGFTKRTSSSFTSSGWYSIVRHPLYFFSTLFMALNPVMTSQWLMLTIMATAYFIIGALVEERRLIVEFGDEYLHYQQRVPFFVPNFAKLNSQHDK